MSEEEKSLIKSYVNYLKSKMELTSKDAQFIEYEITGLMSRRNLDYRKTVEEYVISIL